MYISAVDRGRDDEEWRSFVLSQGFGHLAAVGRDRELPVIVPTQFLLDGDEIRLHLVKQNPLLEAIAEQPRVMLSVAGDWAYIPSDWKALSSEDPALGIPTTYYSAVQLAGTARVVDEPEELAGILRRQLLHQQPEVDVADPLVAHEARLGSIRGLVIAIDDVRAKFKYGGNVDVAHRLQVIERLRQRGFAGDSAAAEHTSRRLAPSRSYWS